MWFLPNVIIAVFNFLFGKITKVVFHAAIISFQLGITTVVIVFSMAYVGFVVTVFVNIYNLIQEFIAYLGSGNSGIVSCFYSVLECSGVSNALQHGINMVFTIIATVLVLHLFGFFKSALILISNELFKLGALIGQVLK